MAADVSVHLPLSPRAFAVLLALADGEQHGYGIAKAAETLSGGTVRLSPGTLYPIIRQMSVDGWIAEIADPGGDPRRRSYRLTPRGRKIAQAEAARLEILLKRARACNLLPA
jgi:DNA-binding PadR family transcriptional regulator